MSRRVSERVQFLIGVVLAAILTLSLAACGGGQPAPPAQDSKPAPTAAQPASKAAEQPKAGEPLKLNMATFNMGSSWYTYGATIAEIVREALPAGSQVNILDQAGGVGNPKLVGDGKVPLAISFNVTDRWAYDGTEEYKKDNKKRDNIRGVAGYLDEYFVGIVARKDLGITDLAQLKEKKPKLNLMTVPVGGLGEVANRLILEAYGMTYNDIKSWGGSVEHTDFNAIADAFRDGKADMFMQTITLGHPTITELSTATQVTFIALSEDVIKKLSDQYGFVRAELPAGAFKGLDKNTPTLGLTSTLITNTSMPDDAVYQITKAINTNADRLRKGHKALEYFDPKRAPLRDGLGVPLHPGAEKYYREAGLLK